MITGLRTAHRSQLDDWNWIYFSPYSTLLSYYLTLLRITNILDLDAENEKLIGSLYLSLQTQCSTAGQNPNEYYLLY